MPLVKTRVTRRRHDENTGRSRAGIATTISPLYVPPTNRGRPGIAGRAPHAEPSTACARSRRPRISIYATDGGVFVSLTRGDRGRPAGNGQGLPVQMLGTRRKDHRGPRTGADTAPKRPPLRKLRTNFGQDPAAVRVKSWKPTQPRETGTILDHLAARGDGGIPYWVEVGRAARGHQEGERKRWQELKATGTPGLTGVATILRDPKKRKPPKPRRARGAEAAQKAGRRRRARPGTRCASREAPSPSPRKSRRREDAAARRLHKATPTSDPV